MYIGISKTTGFEDKVSSEPVMCCFHKKYIELFAELKQNS